MTEESDGRLRKKRRGGGTKFFYFSSSSSSFTSCVVFVVLFPDNGSDGVTDELHRKKVMNCIFCSYHGGLDKLQRKLMNCISCHFDGGIELLQRKKVMNCIEWNY